MAKEPNNYMDSKFNEICRIAIEKGGYYIDTLDLLKTYDDIGQWLKIDSDKNANEIILDPLFWQALGKALGWVDKVCGNCGAIVTDIGVVEYEDCGCDVICGFHQLTWQYYAHQYLDAKFEGKKEEFWKELLKQ